MVLDDKEGARWQELVSAASHLSELAPTGGLEVPEVLRVLGECAKDFSHATPEADFASQAVRGLIDAFIVAAKCIDEQAERRTVDAMVEAERERIHEALDAARARADLAHTREEGDAQ